MWSLALRTRQAERWPLVSPGEKKLWIAIAQNRLPFGFHIHIIDLWIFYTVFTTPPQRRYLHFWSTFQFAFHKYKRLAGLMKFHFKTPFCLLCHDVCKYSFTGIISLHCRATQDFKHQNKAACWAISKCCSCRYFNVSLTLWHLIYISGLFGEREYSLLWVLEGPAGLIACHLLCEEASQVLRLISWDVTLHSPPHNVGNSLPLRPDLFRTLYLFIGLTHSWCTPKYVLKRLWHVDIFLS